MSICCVTWRGSSNCDIRGAEPDVEPHERLKERARARNVAFATTGRDGELSIQSGRIGRQWIFRFFCGFYFPRTFRLRWSPDHLKVTATIEQAALLGARCRVILR
ncbi:MAG: hypothetical protein WD851_10115 [Pirellulales bacterium]